jgi:hypothetical protein
MNFKNWLQFMFYKNTVINQTSPTEQSSSGFFILLQNETWSGGSITHAKLFSQNKAQKLCDKMNKRSAEYGKKFGTSYSVYNTINYNTLLRKKN